MLLTYNSIINKHKTGLFNLCLSTSDCLKKLQDRDIHLLSPSENRGDKLKALNNQNYRVSNFNWVDETTE